MIKILMNLLPKTKVNDNNRETPEAILARSDLYSFMSFSPEQRLWELRQDAKWGRDAETQKRAIQELGKIGMPAISVLQEVMAVSSREDIKGYCQDVINGIANVKTGEAEKNQPEKKEERQISQEKKA